MGAAVARAPSPGATSLQPGIIRAALRAFRVAAAEVIMAVRIRVAARAIIVPVQATTEEALTIVVAVVIHNALHPQLHFATGHTLTLVQEM